LPGPPVRRLTTLALALFVAAATPRAGAGGPTWDAAERQLAFDKLAVLGSVLYVAAHPDDENTAMLAYLSKGRLLRTGYLALTRGDGGQNLIGTEQGAALGVLRSEELLAAREIDGAEQFFTRAIDFGYSKSAEETFSVWDREQVLADVVWVFRRFRPDVIVTRFPTDGQGGHGHHTASAQLALEAFTAAADPARFPEQLAHVRPWQATRIFWNAWRPRVEDRTPEMPPLLAVDLGSYSPLLGASFAEIAARARSMHKSQGFGASSRRGTLPNHLELLAGPPPDGGDFLAGIDTGWTRLPGGAAVQAAVERARAAHDPEQPERAVPQLVAVLGELDRLAPDPWVEGKRDEVVALIRACTGLWLEAVASEPTVTPGATLALTATALNRSGLALTLERIALPFGGAVQVGAPLPDNLAVGREVTVPIPPDTPPTQPYWLAEPPAGALYRVTDPRLTGRPRSRPELRFGFVLRVVGREVTVPVVAEYRRTDPVAGELARPVEVVPPVLIRLDRAVVLFPDGEPRRVTVRVVAGRAGVAGSARLAVPPGFAATPSERPFSLAAIRAEQALEFTVTPPHEPSVGTLTALASCDGATYAHGLATVDHPHIQPQTMLLPAQASLVRTELAIDGRRIGYVVGAGDEVPDALRQMGYAVELLSDEQLAGGDLGGFDAIVTGVRAYNTRTALASAQARLLEYVAAGGTLVVQYNTGRETVTDRLGPYPLELSRDRVTVEGAPVSILVPDHLLLAGPNPITAADFAGWVQERGLYFPGSWDVRYDAPLAMADPGEPATRGAVLYATHGKGAYVYTGLSFFRQLPAGVPGAYRLFANLLAAGKPGG